MHFERNQLSPVSLGFSPLIKNHPRDLLLTTGSRLPSPFRRTSPYSRLAQLVSGRIPVTSEAFTSCPTFLRITDISVSLRLSGLNQMISLLGYTPCPVFQNGRHNLVIHPWYSFLAKLSFRTEPFRPCLAISTWFQILFTSLSRCFSAFYHYTKFAIGL